MRCLKAPLVTLAAICLASHAYGASPSSSISDSRLANDNSPSLSFTVNDDDDKFRFNSSPSFSIGDDRFHLDGAPFQIISGAIHYFRVHPELWADRLVRLKAMGLNTVEVYVPWNLHEPYPGQYTWTGFADLDGFIDIAEKLGLMVLVRAGPYICAEWEFGGFPWWLGSSEVAGGGTMRLRSSDPSYLQHVDRWWGALFSRLRSRLRSADGPVLMVQIENEYGFCGADKDYMHHLVAKARELLGNHVLLYTTDPAHVAAAGSLDGGDVLTTVDFGPGWFYPDQNYATQKELNAPGLSPPMNSEFYSGWLSHWGEPMANTSASDFGNDTDILLRWANNTGNLNFYMAHGGTNFGFWAGANVDSDNTYLPHITSYDYDAPVSEAGDYCQPGIGGECKYQIIRDVISAYTGQDLPPIPSRPTIRAYGSVSMSTAGPLLNAAASMLPSMSKSGRESRVPLPMEEYGQRWGLIMYRTKINADVLTEDGAELDLIAPVHDYATVYLDGIVAGKVHRSGPANLTLPSAAALGKQGPAGDEIVLEIIVEAMGRQNFGCDAFGAWDYKGLQSASTGALKVLLGCFPLLSFCELDANGNCTSSIVGLGERRQISVICSRSEQGNFAGGWSPGDMHLFEWLKCSNSCFMDNYSPLERNCALHSAGKPLVDWEVFNFEFDDVSNLATMASLGRKTPELATARRLLTKSSSKLGITDGPTFYKGTLSITGDDAEPVSDAAGNNHLADTYLDTTGWGKGVAFVNGFNLGWYWPSMGPQMTLYVPGPVLKAGENEIVFLEVEAQPTEPSVTFTDEANFYGPAGAAPSAEVRNYRGPRFGHLTARSP